MGTATDDRDDRRGGHPCRVDLVRHGESAGNVANLAAHEAHSEMLDLATRDMDVPLSRRGEAQARALGPFLPAADRIFVSPYARAIATAALALNAAGRRDSWSCDERLREREFGILDRLTRAGIEARHPEQAAARTFLGKMYHRPPGGESWVDVAARVRSFYRDLRLDHPGCRVTIVTHQAVILLFRYVLEELDERRLLAIDGADDIANTAITTYEGDGLEVPRLIAYNCAHHLPPALHTDRPDLPVAPR